MTGSGESPSVAASPKYSTLELIKHDATAAAPERDHAVVAAENDRQLDALQVSGNNATAFEKSIDEKHRWLQCQAPKSLIVISHQRL